MQSGTVSYKSRKLELGFKLLQMTVQYYQLAESWGNIYDARYIVYVYIYAYVWDTDSKNSIIN